MSEPKIISKLRPLTPYEMYLQQVRTTMDGIRLEEADVTYIPAQFGGLFGQREVINAAVVLDVIDFEVL